MQDLLALRESLSVEQRQAMARDDVPECVGVPASLRRRLSGPIPYAEQVRTTSTEGDGLLPALMEEEGEEAPAPVNDCDTEQESDYGRHDDQGALSLPAYKKYN